MTTIHVRPDCYNDRLGNMPADAIYLTEAVTLAGPGDEVVLWHGRYTEPVEIRVSGTEGAPITFRDTGERSVIFDGQRKPAEGIAGGLDPTASHFAAIKLIDCGHIVLEGLRFENCWPMAFFIEDAHDIAIMNCAGIGGRFFVHARASANEVTHRLLIEGCDWIQDPAFDMWEGRATWPQVKAQAGRTDRSYFNGAMFGSMNVTGRVTIRRNAISHAFNAIRMKIDPAFVEGSAEDPRITRNRDVAIYDNRFAFIRDNAVEPEIGAENWRIAGNRFYNIHAALSIDTVAIRDLVFIGNTLLNNRKPGIHGQESRGGKVIKMLRPKDAKGEFANVPCVGFWSAFNSIQTRTSYAKKGVIAAWEDFGNAIGLWTQDHPIPSRRRPLFTGMKWTGRIRMRAMATNDTDYPDTYAKEEHRPDMTGFATLARVFDAPDPTPESKEPLGGWTGLLPRTPQTQALDCPALAITGVDGQILSIPACLAPGAHPLPVVAPAAWLERWAAPPQAQV